LDFREENFGFKPELAGIMAQTPQAKWTVPPYLGGMNDKGNRYAICALKDRRATMAGEIVQMKEGIRHRDGTASAPWRHAAGPRAVTPYAGASGGDE
jgi:hypothetical protein